MCEFKGKPYSNNPSAHPDSRAGGGGPGRQRDHRTLGRGEAPPFQLFQNPPTPALPKTQSDALKAFAASGIVPIGGLDERVRSIILDPKNNGIFVELGSLSVTKPLLDRVAKAIKDRKIVVLGDKSGTYLTDIDAEYLNVYDILVIRHPLPSTLYSESTAFHECVHAVSDLRALGDLPKIMDEVLAYTAQTQYFRGHGHSGAVPPLPPPPPGKIPDPKILLVFSHAFALGDAFLKKKKLDAADQNTIVQLKKAILDMPVYRGFDTKPLHAYGLGK